MARYSSGDMMAKLGDASSAKLQAKPSVSPGPQVVRVPVGGQVIIRKATNGVIATVSDANWRDTGQVLADKASDLKIE